MVYKHTGKLVPYCLRKKDCCHRGIYAAGKSTQDFSIAHFLTDSFDGLLHKGIHFPVAGTLTYIIDKVGKHLFAFFCMQNFWVELSCVKVLFCILHSRYRTVICMSDDLKSRSWFGDVVVMAHPADGFLRHILKEF